MSVGSTVCTVAARITLLAAMLVLSLHPSLAQVAKHREPYYLTVPALNYEAAVGQPPTPGTEDARRDEEAVRQAESSRTPAQVREAQRDDAQEDIFLYSTVLGAGFNAAALPKTAALSAHLRNDVGTVVPVLKAFYHRPRPFLTDHSLHPVCEKTIEGTFPSGHATVGYLTGLVLAQMVTDKAPAILARSREYASNRVICGVHYPADTEASQRVALVLMGELALSPRFQADLKEVVAELKSKQVIP